jgi:hypothetical protein
MSSAPVASECGQLDVMQKEKQLNFAKTRICRFHGMGICARGDACTFAHSRGELRSAPPNNLSNTKHVPHQFATGPSSNVQRRKLVVEDDDHGAAAMERRRRGCRGGRRRTLLARLRGVGGRALKNNSTHLRMAEGGELKSPCPSVYECLMDSQAETTGEASTSSEIYASSVSSDCDDDDIILGLLPIGGRDDDEDAGFSFAPAASDAASDAKLQWCIKNTFLTLEHVPPQAPEASFLRRTFSAPCLHRSQSSDDASL